MKKKKHLRTWVKILIGVTCWFLAFCLFVYAFVEATNQAGEKYDKGYQELEVVRNNE